MSAAAGGQSTMSTLPSASVARASRWISAARHRVQRDHRGMGSPVATVGHGGPGLSRGQRLAFLQEFDGDAVRRAYEGHVAIPWRAVDRDAAVQQPLAGDFGMKTKRCV